MSVATSVSRDNSLVRGQGRLEVVVVDSWLQWDGSTHFPSRTCRPSQHPVVTFQGHTPSQTRPSSASSFSSSDFSAALHCNQRVCKHFRFNNEICRRGVSIVSRLTLLPRAVGGLLEKESVFFVSSVFHSCFEFVSKIDDVCARHQQRLLTSRAQSERKQTIR